MSDNELPVFLHVLHNFVTISSVFFDVLLLYIAARHTPPHMKSYSVCIIFLCAYEILTATAMFIMFTRVIPLGTDGIVVLFEGPCRYMPLRFCYGVYSVLLNGVSMFNIQTTACFLFRFFVLRHAVPSPQQTALFNLGLAIPAIVWTIAFNLDVLPPREVLNALLNKHAPEYDLSAKALSGILHPLQSPVLPSIIWIIFSSTPCFVLKVWAGFSIRRLLDQEKLNLTARTNRVHREFLSALVWQLIISQSFSVGVFTYLIEQFGLARAPALEFAVHMSGGMAIAASPLVTLYFVKPYRRRFLSILRLRRTRLSENTTVHFVRPNRPHSREFGAISPDRQSVVTTKGIKC